MQGDYYSFNQGPPVHGYAYNGYLPYGYPLQAPTFITNKPIEKIKKQKQRSVDGRKYEDIGNSTDESIHLVRSRKTGESAPNRHDHDQKKRSQSGNSIAKNSAQQSTDSSRRSNQQRNRSQSNERSLSPSNSAVLQNNMSTDSAHNIKKNKKKKDRKNRKGNWNFSDAEQAYTQQYMQYSGSQSGYPQTQYQADSWANDYVQQPVQQYQQAPDQHYYAGQWQQQNSYDVTPGAPQVDCSQYPGCMQAPAQFDQGYQQPYYPDQCQPCPPCPPCPQYGQDQGYQCYELPPQPIQQSMMQQNCQPQGYQQQQQNAILPPGAKIVAEYFLGYLDEQQPGQSNPCQPSQSEYQTQYQTYQQAQSSSDSSKEDVDIEVWEKSKKKDKKKRDSSSDSSDNEKRSKDNGDLEKLKDDIIKTIQKELGNLKLENNSRSEPIQPIFLMPKQAEQAPQKPIYIPRNVYVPVVRPVFVPRERIIVRPQIIHVARPVLVDRPVPIQQRPIVIERDRPVPVRVETIEKTEPMNGNGNCTETTRNIETGQEVTYHEFTQTYPNSNGDYPSSGNFQYNEHSDYEDRRKQEMMNIIEESERRKQGAQSKSNEDLYNSKAFESILSNSQGYTLEVLDQRISDKFEKTDQETIKARYGVDSYHYLPPGSELNNGNRPSSAGGSNAEFYGSNGQNLGTSSSFKSVNDAKVNSSSNNLFGYGNSADVYGSMVSPGSRNALNQSQ